MTKAIIAALAFFVLCSAAQATPAIATRHDAALSHSHKYWLSDGLNRLVFWQPPASTHVNAQGH